jgi:hypothetical protein
MRENASKTACVNASLVAVKKVPIYLSEKEILIFLK